MNCRSHFRIGSVTGCRAAAGFTMVEIAIALGVIGFALVAIIGILPSGLEVQRDNRSETIINQDATFWIEAIRNGSMGLDDLTNHVEKIELVEWSDPVYRTQVVSIVKTYTYKAGNDGYLNGSNIIGLLTAGVAEPNPIRGVRALVSAISGSASEKGGNPVDREVGFSYRMNVDIYQPGADAPSFSEISTNQIGAAADVLDNLYELRLSLSYPFVRDDRPSPRRQVFRTTVSRNLLQLTNQVPFHYFFVP